MYYYSKMGSGGSKQSDNAMVETLGDHSGSINCLAASEDGTILVTGSDDATARMWSVSEDATECLGVLRGHLGQVAAVAIFDTFVVTASADATVRKWDMTTCECLFVYRGHTSRIHK